MVFFGSQYILRGERKTTYKNRTAIVGSVGEAGVIKSYTKEASKLYECTMQSPKRTQTRYFNSTSFGP